MTKPVLLLAVAVLLAGCPSVTPGTPGTTPGTTVPGVTNPLTGPTKLTNLNNAELDGLIECAKSKGTLGAALVNGWGALKTSTAEGSREMLKPAVEIQAKAIGCL